MPIRIRLEVREDVEVDEIGTGEEAPRRTYIKKKFYERYGYTDGCEGCNRLRAGLTRRGHDEGCRSRMEKEMEKDEDGQGLLKGARSRREAYMEEKIRTEDEGRKVEDDAKREREKGKEEEIHVPAKKTRSDE